MRLVAVQKLFGPDKVGLWRTLERKHTIKCEAASQVVCERELPRLFTWEVYHLMGFFYFSSCNCSFCCACGGLIVLLLLRGQHLKSRYECQIAVLVNRALVSFYLTTALQDLPASKFVQSQAERNLCKGSHLSSRSSTYRAVEHQYHSYTLHGCRPGGQLGPSRHSHGSGPLSLLSLATCAAVRS